jgi:hypothetical protein
MDFYFIINMYEMLIFSPSYDWEAIVMGSQASLVF